jgi:DNA (cytosine-5)-methyltransferase 1
MNVLDLFSGVGGFSLGLNRAGMTTVAFCEIDPFCQKVLKKHWPDVPIFSDIKQLTKKVLEDAGVRAIDLICGGPPCQPVSLAGQRKGAADDRWLWPEALRLVEETRPAWCLFENPPGIISMGLDGVLTALENQGYETWPADIPACGVNAADLRYRIWVVAHTDGGEHESSGAQPDFGTMARCYDKSALAHSDRAGRRQSEPAGNEFDREDAGRPKTASRAGESDQDGAMADSECDRREGRQPCSWGETAELRQPSPGCGDISLADPSISRDRRLPIQPGRPQQANVDSYRSNAWNDYEWAIGRDGKARRIKPGICGMAHGIPHRVDRLRALGNAVVVPLVEVLGRYIMETERQMQNE